jgi:glutathione S-transferase
LKGINVEKTDEAVLFPRRVQPEAGFSFEHEKVDLKAKRTDSGIDYTTVNPKGYVPALTLDSGETVTENIAILDWIAHQDTALKPSGTMGHTHLLVALAFISTEIHKSFKPFFAGGRAEEKRFGYLADTIEGDYLFGDKVSVADCYLFVMLLWADKNQIEVPAKLSDFAERMEARPAVRKAMEHEKLV